MIQYALMFHVKHFLLILWTAYYFFMIEYLQISDLRNLQSVILKTSGCNVLIGENGSGKTSLLEGLFLLSRGKSFRHHQPKRYIQHQKQFSTVFARLANGDSLAIQKGSDASTILRHNQMAVYSQSILAQKLPMLLIDPSSMDLLEQGSSSRRQLLDWLTFHVKQGFHQQWLAYQRLLKQRNALLKQHRYLTSSQSQELFAWDNGLSNHASLIHHYRQQVFEQWQPYFRASFEQLLPQYASQVSLSYLAGFDVNKSLVELLQSRIEQDLQMGYTRVGCHRADISVSWLLSGEFCGVEQATNVLSRGEKKLLITALRLSQLPLLQANSSPLTSLPIILLDDITAELDKNAVQVLLSTLARLPCQVFITSLHDEILQLINHYWQDYCVFHVKQGRIDRAL